MRLIIEDVRHLKLREQMLILGMTTLVTVVMWITYAIYIAYNKPQVDEEVVGLLSPLDPNLDQETLTGLEGRVAPPTEFTIVREGEAPEITGFEAEGRATASAATTRTASGSATTE